MVFGMPLTQSGSYIIDQTSKMHYGWENHRFLLLSIEMGIDKRTFFNVINSEGVAQDSFFVQQTKARSTMLPRQLF